jgi:hypothetical protein
MPHNPRVRVRLPQWDQQLPIGGGFLGITNIDDYYWGKGPVGPSIVPSTSPGTIDFWLLNGWIGGSAAKPNSVASASLPCD